MKFFLVLPFLLLLFGGSQESTLSHKRITRGLNTTLQTNFNGTYQRKNPCTNAEIESSSYIASHEFRHHINENKWSDYGQKCSAIISSFLQGIGNLVRFNNRQNGTFNFHINTSISQKQDGHCDSEKQCETLPTIVIEAESCELPPSCKCPSKERENKFLSKKDFPEGGTRNPIKIPKIFPILQQIEKSIFNKENYPTTQCPTKGKPSLIPLQDAVSYPGNERLENKNGLENTNFNPIPEYPEPNTQGGMPDFPQEFFNDFPQNGQMTGPEQNPEFLGGSASGRDLTASITIQPEDDFSTAYPDETSPLEAGEPGLGDPSEFLPPPAPSQDFTQGSFGNQNLPSPTISDCETTPEPTFVNDRLPNNQYQPSQVNRQQNFGGLGVEIPDFQMNQPPVNQQPPSRATTSTAYSKTQSTQIEKPFIKAQPAPVVIKSPVKPLKPYFEKSEEMISSSEKLQPAELANPVSQMAVPAETNPFQQRAPLAPNFDDEIPYPTPSLMEQNEYIPEMTNSQTFNNPIPSVPTQDNNFPNYPDQPPQNIPFEEYNEPIMKSPEVEDSFSNEKQTTSQANAFSDYDSNEYLMPTAPLQLPTTPPPFPQVPADQILTNPSDTEIPSPKTDFFPPLEKNKPFPPTLSPDNFRLPQRGFESRKDNIRNRKIAKEQTLQFEDQSKMSSDVNLAPMTPPFDLPTPYKKPEVLPSFQTKIAPKMQPSESLIGEFEEQPPVDQRIPQDSTFDYESTYENTTPNLEFPEGPRKDTLIGEPVTEQPLVDQAVPEEPIFDYGMSPDPEFREKPVEEPSFKLPSSESSFQYLTTPPPNQIPPPPVDFNNQQSYNDQSSAYGNGFQPKPQPPVTPFYDQPIQSPIGQTVTALPPDSFLPKSRPNVISEPKPQRFPSPNKVSDEVMTTPIPTLHSQNDYLDSSSSQPKLQDTEAPAIEKPFPDSLTKHSPGMPPSALVEEPSFYSDPFLNEPPMDDSDLPEDISDDYIPVMENPHKKEKMLIDDELSLDDTTAPPNLDSFTIYDSDKPTPNPDFLMRDEPKLTSPPRPNSFKNDAYSRGQAFSNVETASNFKSSSYAEQASNNQNINFQPLMLPNQKLNTPRPEFKSFTTPMPPVADKPRKQAKTVTYSEASAQSSSEVFNRPVSKSYSEAHSSSYSSPVQKKTPSFTSDNQRSSNVQMIESAGGFRQPPRFTSDVKPNFPSEDIFPPSERPAELEQPDYYTFEKPVGGLQPQQNFDEIAAPDSADYPADFLPTTPSPEDQAQPFLTYSNAESEAESMAFNDQLPPRDSQQEDLPFLENPQGSVTDSMPTDAPDLQFTNPPFSKIRNEQTESESFTPTPPEFVRPKDYPVPLELPQPQPNYVEENPNSYSPSIDRTFISQPQSQTSTEAKSFAASSASFPAKEPFVVEETAPSVPQTNFNFPKKVPNYSPLEPQPQPFDDNLDNAPSQPSRTFDSLTITSQNAQSDFKESSIQESTSAEGNTQSSEDFVAPMSSFSVTEIPSFQIPALQLKSDLLTASNERSQENTGAQETLILGDNVSPQLQPTNAVKYNEELETTQYQTSPAPNPQPQTTLNYANQLSDDNPSGKLPEFFTEQQPSENYDFNTPSSLDQNPSEFLQPEEAVTEESGPIFPDDDSQQTEETFTTDYPIDMTSPLPLPTPKAKESYLPYNNQLRTQPIYQQPSPIEEESLTNPSTDSPQSLPEPLDFSTQQLQNSETFTRNQPPSVASGVQRRPQPRNYPNRISQTSNSRFPSESYNKGRNLNNNPRRYSRINETQFTSSFEPRRPPKFQPLSSENTPVSSEEYRPPSRNFPQYPQQVETFPDQYDALRGPESQQPFSGQNYPDYDQAFPNPPPTYDEVIPQDSQMDDGNQQFDQRVTDLERQRYFQQRPMKNPEEQEHSNPLFQTLRSQMAFSLHDTPSDMPKQQNNFRGFRKDTREPPQPESQLVSDITNPSNNPERTTNGRINYMDRPLYEDSMRSVSAPESF